MATQPDEPRRVLHPRDLVCPRCGAGVDRACSFAGRVQEELHCTERLLALGDPGLHVESPPEPSPSDEKPAAADPPKKRRPPPSAPASEPEPPVAPRAETPSPTLF